MQILSRKANRKGRRQRPLSLTAIVLVSLACLPSSAQVPGVPGVSGNRTGEQTLTAERLVKVRVAADVGAIEPGATFHLAVVFQMEPEWHIYWTDAGASGQPTEVQVKGPLGYTIGATRYPRPEIIEDPAGATFGYHGEVVLFVPITAPKRFMPGVRAASFDVEIDYFVCRKRCLIGRASRSVDVELADLRTDPRTDPAPVPDAKIIEKHKQLLPRALTELRGASAYIDQHGITPSLVISGTSARASEVSFLPISTPGITCHGPNLEIDGERFLVRIPLQVRRQNALGHPIVVRGLLTFGKKRDEPCYDVAVDLDGRPLEERGADIPPKD